MKANKKYPIEKYRVTTEGNAVTAESTYAGKPVRGVAKCDPSDTFSKEKGVALAAARCNAKVAKKRMARAEAKMLKLTKAMVELEKQLNEAKDYVADAMAAKMIAEEELKNTLMKM